MSAASRGDRRVALGLLAASGLLTTALVGAGTPASAAPADPAAASGLSAQLGKVKKATPGDKLGRTDRSRLTTARAQKKARVTVMVTVPGGQDARAQAEVRGLGGVVRYAAPKLGYFSASLPTDAVERTAQLDSVSAVDLDEVVRVPDVRPSPAGGVDGNLQAPDGTTPEVNPFLPTTDTESISFRAHHPGYDGRGVTIGVLDTGVDLAHPSLNTTSMRTRKIVDWFTATDPVTEGSLVAGGDATWLPMLQDATGPSFGPYRDSTWKLPPGTYKIRTFDEVGTDVPGCEDEGGPCGDVNRDGDTTDRFGVLFDPVSHDIRVDSDNDKDFRNNRAMQPYRQDYDQGTFGTDKPFTDVKEAIPFTVDFRLGQSLAPLGVDQTVDFVDIGIVSGDHGSHVAGIAAAHSLFGGRMNGQAPGAELVSARACTFGPGCTNAALTDGMAELASNRGVDIINMSIGGLPALNDGDNARAELYDRIINDLGVQLVISAGNSGNALNTVGDPSVATDVVSVGASITKATWKSNYGSDVAFDKGMMTFSSGGPREDGGFKPNVTAPGSAISTIPTWRPGAPVAEAGYDLPPGYAMFNGTSMASPQAAGAMALLISGAKQAGLTHLEPAALRQAVYSSSVYNPGVPAFLQGNGEVNTPAAWNLLTQELVPDTFTISAPVCTEIWKLLGRNTGTGLYNRCAAGQGGLAAGEQRTYPVTITRTSGPGGARPYALSIVGNDGTFSLGADSVRLTRGKATTVQVTVRPSEGAHSAVLKMDATETPGLDAEMMLAVVASPALSAPAYSRTITGQAKRNVSQRYYLTVPEGAKAMQVQLSGLAENSQTRFLAFHPYGVPIESASSLVCYSNREAVDGCDPYNRVYSNPQPGVWELLVESRRTSPLLNNPFSIKVAVLGATVTPPVQTLDSVSVGVPVPVSFTVRNDFGPVKVTGKGGPLGSALSDRPSVADGGELVRTVVVPAGATSLDVRIGNPAVLNADLDLFVDGPSGPLQAADGDSEEAVHYDAPAPGTYTITVDGYDVPGGSTLFDYLDVFASPALGSLTITSGPVPLASGATTTLTGKLVAKRAPADGRSLSGSLSVVSASGATLGTATVLVDAVRP